MNVGTPLRPTDSNRLGRYQLLRRLGEGGMGTVYLGRTGTGNLVAIKVIRSDYADDPEFRRRFRSEVAHAQNVPPFCTAEVIDADPDHEPPYLVVEYVDGPSLTRIVNERGPLSPSNLQALAIGVATALTAIHRAGVIHRDLKPSNVLLAPGSPKVIDFGIARAADAVTGNTRTDQLMGTVAYMAPERLEPATSDTITSAADIFAWGAVVAFAANGFPPYHGDTPATTAIVILTGEPDLGDLQGPLRDLVARALATDPADRPTARELLDELLAIPAPGHFSGDHHRAPTARVGDRRVATDEALTHGVANAQFDIGGRSGRRVRVPAPRTDPPRAAAPGRRRRGRRVLIAALVLALLATGGILAGVLSGAINLGGRAGQRAGLREPGSGTSPSLSFTTPQPFPKVYLQDPLTHPIGGHFTERADPGDGFNASCRYGPHGYDVQFSKIGQTSTWRCAHPADRLGDVQISVDVVLDTPGSCAGVWFRFFDVSAGYAMQICENTVTLGLHSGDYPMLQPLSAYTNQQPLQIGRKYRFSVVADGDLLTMMRCEVTVVSCLHPTVLGQARDNRLPNPGTVQVGIFEPGAAERNQIYRVTFTDLEISTPDDPSATPSS
jgi:hypothetical protein